MMKIAISVFLLPKEVVVLVTRKSVPASRPSSAYCKHCKYSPLFRIKYYRSCCDCPRTFAIVQHYNSCDRPPSFVKWEQLESLSQLIFTDALCLIMSELLREQKDIETYGMKYIAPGSGS